MKIEEPIKGQFSTNIHFNDRGITKEGEVGKESTVYLLGKSMRNKIVLLVEDDPGSIELARRALGKNHIVKNLVIAQDGQEALDYLFGTWSQAKGDTPRLPVVVLLDLNMPGVDGLEILRRIRADDRTKLLPVVIFTSSTNKRDMEKCYDLGANSYIYKPVDPKQFADAVRQLSLYWLVLNEFHMTG
ncbi:MAG TPA: response regulator [Syntrophales bacterium]|nr:response regulator [Syntrophales bacterium]